MVEKSIQGLFLDICSDARWDGCVKFGLLSSVRRASDHPERKPGLFYSRLPDKIKERIKNELKSCHVQSPLRDMIMYGDVVPYGEDIKAYKTCEKAEKLKFEAELMKHGWKPNFRL